MQVVHDSTTSSSFSTSGIIDHNDVHLSNDADPVDIEEKAEDEPETADENNEPQEEQVDKLLAWIFCQWNPRTL